MPKRLPDATDMRILAALQGDGRLSNVDLAAQISLSPSPCLRRTRRLEGDGVIRGYRATIDRTRVGLGLTVFVAIDFLAEVVVRDLTDYERLLTDKLLTLPMVTDIRSNFALRTIKADGSLPLPSPTPSGTAA
jgi:Lrp/AsnC family leucine-responsive transcriptional regulator